MSLDFRKDLRELLILIAIASVAFFCMNNAQAQNCVPLTLDMHVTRYPVSNSGNINNQTLSSSVERIQILLINKDKGIMFCSRIDTLFLRRIKSYPVKHLDIHNQYIGTARADLYLDLLHNRKYIVYRFITLKSIFQYEFVPFLNPHPNIGEYAIHITPVVAVSQN